MRPLLTRSSYVLAIAAAVGLGACSVDVPTAPGATQVADQPSLSMAAPQPSVAKYEVYYMEFTINHHLAGLVMAQLCIERAVHEELRMLCHQSLESQRHQIAELRAWLHDWYGIDYTGEIEQDAQQDIRRLSVLSGAAFEDAFLTEFSKHHLRIIKESQKAVRTAHHDPLRALAHTIITAQSHQVIKMQTWDCRWYGDCRQGLTHQVGHS